MKKKVLLMLTVSIMVVTLTSTAFAFGGGNNPLAGEECPREMLTGEEQDSFESIISNFREKMAELREEMISLREVGNYEEFREKHAERFELMEEKKEALSDILPDEVNSRFQSKGHSMRHNGWKENSDKFNQNNSNR